MRIRSITLFDAPERLSDATTLRRLGAQAATARQTFEAAGFEVQTVRLATRAYPKRSRPAVDPDSAVRGAVALETEAEELGFEYVALGPLPAALPEADIGILQETRRTFLTMQLVTPGSGRINLDAVHAAAQVMVAAAGIEEGFGNLRFAALANVRPGTPFFPAAYHDGGSPAFAIATEAADLAVAACQHTRSAQEAHDRLRSSIEGEGQRLSRIASGIAETSRLRFGGIDFSLAPFPEEEISIGAALEALSGQPLGRAGTLAAAATLTAAVQSARFPHVGFCGLMLPVLEDPVLARRAAEGRLGLGELLQWSAVCGTGLDTVPLPGDASEESLSHVLLDVAALAARLRKPLTARLMPLPEKQAGDPVHFDFAYFADGGVLALEAVEPGSLSASPDLTLQALGQHRRTR